MPSCQTCGLSNLKPSDVVWRRGYYWHKDCYEEDSFPSNGKIIPDHIVTYENTGKSNDLPSKNLKTSVRE